MKGIPEENLEAFCLEILDVNVLDAKQVKEQIAEIIVPRPNVVVRGQNLGRQRCGRKLHVRIS